MSIVLTQHRQSSSKKETVQIISTEANEFMVFCPKCGTLETVWFTEDGLIVPTRKFTQKGARLYHDCGAYESCYLYRTS